MLVSTWINTALMVDALRSNRPLDDSATIDAVIRPDAERGVSMQYLAQRDAKRPPITDAEADSLADIDAVRVFQQILVRLPINADSLAAAAVSNRAKALLKRAQDGANFTALAIEASPDSQTRRAGGYLPALTRDQVSRLPRQMQQIWMLKPGGISNPFISSAGVHIMRRATRTEARAQLKQFLAPIRAHRADSLFVDSLATAQHIVVPPDARPRVRLMAVEPVIAADSAPMATWQGGVLTPAMVRSATLMLDPATRVRLSNGSDSAITSYLIELAKRKIVLTVVAPGPGPTLEARGTLAPAYRNALGTLRESLGHLPATLNAGDAAEPVHRFRPGGPALRGASRCAQRDPAVQREGAGGFRRAPIGAAGRWARVASAARERFHRPGEVRCGEGHSPTGRPAAAMSIVATASGVRLTLHVRPGAAQSAITGPHGDAIGVRVAAAPVDGNANRELIGYLAGCLGVRPRAIALVAGLSSRRKVIEVAGIDVTTATQLLQPVGSLSTARRASTDKSCRSRRRSALG